MPLSITSIQRVHAAPCQHYQITVDDNGTARQVEIYLPDMDTREAWVGLHPSVALALLWARYKRAAGATAASLIGVEIA